MNIIGFIFGAPIKALRGGDRLKAPASEQDAFKAHDQQCIEPLTSKFENARISSLKGLMIKTFLLLSLAVFSLCSWAQTSKPHFVAKPSDRSVLGSQKVATRSLPVPRAPDQVYHYKNADGVVVFSDRPPETGHYQVRIYDCYACKPSSNINWQSIPLFTQQYKEDIRLAAKTYSIEAALIRAVIHAESAFKPAALSKTGAQGLMQLMPATAKELGVTDAFKPSQNIEAGSRYLAQLLKRFGGDITLACAAYNAGASRVDQYRGVPPFPETKAYVERVNILLQRYRKSSFI